MKKKQTICDMWVAPERWAQVKNKESGTFCSFLKLPKNAKKWQKWLNVYASGIHWFQKWYKNNSEKYWYAVLKIKTPQKRSFCFQKMFKNQGLKIRC